MADTIDRRGVDEELQGLELREARRQDGCVTNFEHDGGKMTIWKHGDWFTLAPFGVLQSYHDWTCQPLFQSLAAEIHRLASDVGKLRRKEIETRRSLLQEIDAVGSVNRSAVDRICPRST